MTLLYWLIGAYVVYYIVLFLSDGLQRNSLSTDDEDTQIINVKDMVGTSGFKPQMVKVSDTARSKYMDKDKIQISSQRDQATQRVTGAIFAQGFEVDNYNSQLMKGGKAVFTGNILIN